MHQKETLTWPSEHARMSRMDTPTESVEIADHACKEEAPLPFPVHRCATFFVCTPCSLDRASWRSRQNAKRSCGILAMVSTPQRAGPRERSATAPVAIKWHESKTGDTRGTCMHQTQARTWPSEHARMWRMDTPTESVKIADDACTEEASLPLPVYRCATFFICMPCSLDRPSWWSKQNSKRSCGSCVMVSATRWVLQQERHSSSAFTLFIFHNKPGRSFSVAPFDGTVGGVCFEVSAASDGSAAAPARGSESRPQQPLRRSRCVSPH